MAVVQFFGESIKGTIYLAQNDNYINTNSKYPSFTVTPSKYYLKRKLVKTASNVIAQKQIEKVTLSEKDSWYSYVDEEYIVVWKGCNVIVKCIDYDGKMIDAEVITGDLGENYSVMPKQIPGYDLTQKPANEKGVYTKEDIIVEYKYDFANGAKVSFEDLLSGVVLAKYWYNEAEENFVGDGTDFENNTVFEKYGYYKIMVENGVGLKKEMTFCLNQDSVKR